ncbi:DUF2933 domain-containing protein [Paenibacillus sp. GM2]|uniref:DUF2933 domain-containing protein n=1 Tax=Paenibacillus sp. GM2 TaxID=1622070 RepID=UPI00083809BB|nr:DUF2933 domain-containing protein [Paenibacillus sp. GM2]
MEWSWLLVLVCPLMMIFMMFGMKGSHSYGHGQGQASPSNVDQGVQQQLSELREQNELLRREVEKLSRKPV